MSLREGIQDLTSINRAFNDTAARQARIFGDVSLPRLERAIDRIDALAKPLEPADSHMRQWLAFAAGKLERLSSRVIRNLSWYPEVAMDEQFLKLVFTSDRIRSSAKTIQGLVYSCHSTWNEVHQQRRFLDLRDLVRSYKGHNGVVRLWRKNIQTVLSSDSVKKLAQKLLREKASLQRTVEELRLFEDTQFIREVVSDCASSCSSQLCKPEVLDYFVNQILSWYGHPIETYKEHVSAAVMSDAFDSSGDVKERLVNFVVNDAERLGDPRLRPASWIGLEAPKNRVLQYLSKEDIIFFFKKVMKNDSHGRAKFWLNYVPSMTRSRPLLTDVDRLRLSTALTRDGNRSRHFGRTAGQHSAFLLDFGRVLAIEFEGVGACYLYDARTRDRYFRDFYTDEPFNDQLLKRPNDALYRKRHQGNWEWVLGQALAQSGIYPS